MLNKKKLINISMVVISTIITLVVSEMLFRVVLFSDHLLSSQKIPEYYSGHIVAEDDVFYNDNYWKLNYLFRKPINFESPHPLLGWTGKFYWKTLDHFEQDTVKGRRPVLLYGDSFAMCVDSVTCFEDYLNQDSLFAKDHYFLNYGVGGYGVDQIYLLLNETVDRFEKPFVVLSLLTSDLDRSMLTVRDGQKPYFEVSGDSVELKGVPIQLTSEEYFEENPPEVTSYLWNKFKTSQLYNNVADSLRVSQYIEKSKNLNRGILQKAFRRLRASNIDFVVLIFHPEHQSENNWRLQFLRNLCLSSNVTYICDYDVKNSDATFSTYETLQYSIKDDGHPTSYANGLISKELGRYILNSEYRKRYDYHSILYLNDRIAKNEAYFKRQMTGSPQWMESLKKKAIQNKIPLNSMLSLDARYMANQGKGLDDYKREILDSPEWLEAVRQKAVEKNISLDSMVLLDAQYMVNQSN